MKVVYTACSRGSAFLHTLTSWLFRRHHPPPPSCGFSIDIFSDFHEHVFLATALRYFVVFSSTNRSEGPYIGLPHTQPRARALPGTTVCPLASQERLSCFKLFVRTLILSNYPGIVSHRPSPHRLDPRRPYICLYRYGAVITSGSCKVLLTRFPPAFRPMACRFFPANVSPSLRPQGIDAFPGLCSRASELRAFPAFL